MERSNRVVCIADLTKSYDQWGRSVLELTSKFPKKDEICKVVEALKVNFCKMVYRLEGYEFLWDAEMFRPVDEQFGADICERIEHDMEEYVKEFAGLFKIYKLL